MNRHFKEHLDVDIVNYNEFKEANQVFIAQCVKLKREGRLKQIKNQLKTKKT